MLAAIIDVQQLSGQYSPRMSTNRHGQKHWMLSLKERANAIDPQGSAAMAREQVRCRRAAAVPTLHVRRRPSDAKFRAETVRTISIELVRIRYK